MRPITDAIGLRVVKAAVRVDCALFTPTDTRIVACFSTGSAPLCDVWLTVNRTSVVLGLAVRAVEGHLPDGTEVFDGAFATATVIAVELPQELGSRRIIDATTGRQVSLLDEQPDDLRRAWHAQINRGVALWVA